jgi:uncharacterized protein
MIRETVLTTRSSDGRIHIAPMGVHERPDGLMIAPFRPSATLDNLLREGFAAINCVDDVRIIAGCLTGRRDWPTAATERVPGARLADALSHQEVALDRVEDDPLRPRLLCRIVHEGTHKPFRGFNRAQAAVVEAAILASRLHMLPSEKIEQELAYLTIAMDKTAGAREREAWNWLMEKIETFRRHQREACA